MVPKFYNLKLHSLGFSRNLHYFIYNGKYSNTCNRMNAQFHTNISPMSSNSIDGQTQLLGYFFVTHTLCYACYDPLFTFAQQSCLIQFFLFFFIIFYLNFPNLTIFFNRSSKSITSGINKCSSIKQ